MTWSLLLLLACSRVPRGQIEAEPVETWRGEGYAVTVPVGAVVRVEADRLAVDAADGGRWFDVRWVAPPESPQALLNAQANAQCDSVRWDRATQPTADTALLSAICPIATRRHWILALQEKHGERTLVTTYTAAADRLTLEDAWVDFLRTAATLSPGSEPLPPVPADEVRARLREVANSGGIGHVPVPGGGELSPRMGESLADTWSRKVAMGAPPVPGG